MTLNLWTNNDLIIGARERGYALESRKIVNWTQHGLLDAPQRRGTGRGSQLAVRPDTQAQLLWVLLKQQRTATKLATLANVPVAIWLGWGEEYIPLRQVRRAMHTFTMDNRSSPATRARVTARHYIDLLNAGPVSKATRMELENTIIDMCASPRPNLGGFAERFLNALRHVQAPHGSRFDLPHLEAFVEGVDARLRAADLFRRGADGTEYSDQVLRKFQVFHSQSLPAYVEAQRLTRQQAVTELANNACSTLLLLCGLETIRAVRWESS